MKLGIAVIGTGFMARKHCDALAGHERARLVSICSTPRSAASGEELRARHGFARSVTDPRRAIEDGEVDVVYVCTPDSTHAELVCAALDAGKHVLCEKPLARSADEFARIGAALARSGRRLQVGMNPRFRDQYAKARSLVTQGTLGALRFLRATYVVNIVESIRKREKPWWLDRPREINPFLHGGAIFAVDLLRWTAGEVASVFARSSAHELGAEFGADMFSVSLRFRSGVPGELLVAAGAMRPNDFSLEAWLSEGSILGTKTYARGPGPALAASEIPVEQRTIDVALQFSDLVRAIEAGATPLNSFDEALGNFRTLEAIRHSASAGGPVDVANPNRER